MISADKMFLAYLDEMNIITILLPVSYHHGQSASFYLTTDGDPKLPLQIVKKTEIEHHVKYICRFTAELTFGKHYWIYDEYGGIANLQIGAVIRTKAFDEKFYYDGDDLGVTFSADQTHFKLWAPTASGVKLKIRPADSEYAEIIKMRREDRGVWSITVNRDLEYYHYSFFVLVNQEWREAVDPYARTVTADGEHGVIVRLEKTARPKLSLPPLDHPVDAIIYETHIRDFTIQKESGVREKGRYLGAGELNTVGPDGQPTGLTYVKDLGVTHIEFLPFHDFAGVDKLNPAKDYNWGYNPLHFNAPEGSYSTDPTNPYSRIIELKTLIDQAHSIGLRVIMDVVYNHVYIRENSSFEKIAPGYYFRHNEIGLPSNGTGVGNDVASERKMVLKFIVDSIRFWLEEYHIDGFRFDLMGILDVETMAEVRKVCDHVSKEILTIGEGWNLNTPLPFDQKAIIANQAKLPEVAQFNDKFRDTMKGSTFNLFDKGFALGNEHHLDAAFEVMMGSIGVMKKENWLFNQPSQTVNYIECHDNHTLWDKLQACFPEDEDSIRMKYHRLATGLVILSQGIPFLHSGQEFFRTKNGDGNSYRSPDTVNQLDWKRKSQFSANVKFIKGLIQIRKKFPCFRIRSAEEIRSQVQRVDLESPLLGFLLTKDSEQLLIVVNPTRSKKNIPLPNGKWTILADHEFAGISSNKIVEATEIKMEAISIFILLKK